MLQKIQPNPEALKSSKDRAFGEYAKHKDHLCSCYAYGGDGPPQYNDSEVYFCFSKFKNPFSKKWIARYAGLSVLTPVLDVLHDVERRVGRALQPPEWGRVDGVLIQGIKPMHTSAKGLQALCERVEMWLSHNMIDEIDHRLTNNVQLGKDWAERNAALCRIYGDLPWARIGSNGKDWMRLHATTSTLEMLRQTDHLYMMIPVPYVEPPKEVKDSAVEDEKAKAGKAAAGALMALESIEAQVEPTQPELLE